MRRREMLERHVAGIGEHLTLSCLCLLCELSFCTRGEWYLLTDVAPDGLAYAQNPRYGAEAGPVFARLYWRLPPGAQRGIDRKSG